ncbi:hypothetical protein F511_37086 [Dorcoceras hygrometricum]|uniref:Uncharacterized protein n=1 Tax=Dorcoceras hygrometricum TaxID=472368 RepID=A0A2Z7CES7_9LAMI|nr:hypothetical protein F511_37086 [Dorcoceras hygrometricum]
MNRSGTAGSQTRTGTGSHDSGPDSRFLRPGTDGLDPESARGRTAAQLRDLVSSINLEKLQSQELLSSFKSDFIEIMTRGDKLIVDLSSEITANRLMLQKQSAKINSSLASLSPQLAEVVAHLKRAGDVKKGEGGKSSSRKGESSSDGKRRWF